MAEVYLYALIDPRNDALRYVGQTRNPSQRHRQHLKDGRLRPEKGRCAAWVRELQDAGFLPELVILEQRPEAERHEAESFWIAYFRFIGCDLLNLTAGGAGIVDPSPLTRAKMRASHRGQRHSEEWKRALSERMRGEGNHFSGRSHTAEANEKNRAAHLGTPCPWRGKSVPRSTWECRLKTYILTSPDGVEHVVTHLAAFCSEHGLTRSTLMGAMPGKKWKHHKGWTIRFADQS